MTTPRRVCLALAAISTAASAYLTYAHFTSPDVLACAESGAVNCAAVTTSTWSSVAGIPVAVLGLLWSAAMVLLFSPAGDRLASADRLRLIGAGAGMAAVLWLVYVELFLVRAICLWCTVVHLAAFGMFAITASTREVQAE